MRVAAAEHRQEGQAGHAGIGVGPGVGAAAAVGRGLAAGLVPPGFPAAVFALMLGQPLESGLYGGLGLLAAATGQGNADVIARNTQFIGLRHRACPDSDRMVSRPGFASAMAASATQVAIGSRWELSVVGAVASCAESAFRRMRWCRQSATTLFSSAAWAVLKSCKYLPAASAICHPEATEAVAANCFRASCVPQAALLAASRPFPQVAAFEVWTD